MKAGLTHVVQVTDANDNPTGGSVAGVGFTIAWQDGPLKQNDHGPEPTGAFLEDVIEACIRRLEFFQESKYACDENERALSYLRCANRELDLRTKRRVEAGTEGKYEGN